MDDMGKSKKVNLPKYLLTKGRSGGPRGPMIPRDGNVVPPSSSVPLDAKKKQELEAATTPANIKRKQVMNRAGFINSPTDSFLSPCSQKLFKRPAGTEVNSMANVAKLNLIEAVQEEDMEEEQESTVQE